MFHATPTALGGCHFLRVALDYVRSSAPNPSLPILLFDEPPDHMLSAIKSGVRRLRPLLHR